MDGHIAFIYSYESVSGGQIKELLSILAKYLVKSPITSDEVGVGK